jgi:hypothetical protein
LPRGTDSCGTFGTISSVARSSFSTSSVRRSSSWISSLRARVSAIASGDGRPFVAESSLRRRRFSSSRVTASRRSRSSAAD